MSDRGRKYHALQRRTRVLRTALHMEPWTRRELHTFVERLLAWQTGFNDRTLKDLIRMYNSELLD